MRPLIAVLLLTITTSAQAPALIRLPMEPAKQMRVILDEQAKLAQQYTQLEQAKVTIKYRACLEAKMDAAQCDGVDVVPDKDGFVFQPKPKETK